MGNLGTQSKETKGIEVIAIVLLWACEGYETAGLGWDEIRQVFLRGRYLASILESHYRLSLIGGESEASNSLSVDARNGAG